MLPRRGLRVVHDAAADAALDELDPLLRDALVVERHWQAGWIGALVVDRHELAADLLADLDERPPLLDREGRRSTGHGLPAPNPYGPFPLNTIMAAGSTSRDELIGGLDRGLLVTRFHYTNPVHPKLAIITGMTRDGTFLVEGGRIVGPVRNLRFTQSYLQALAGVVAVGRERKTLRGFLGGSVVPALRIEAFTFTGATEH